MQSASSPVVYKIRVHISGGFPGVIAAGFQQINKVLVARRISIINKRIVIISSYGTAGLYFHVSLVSPFSSSFFGVLVNIFRSRAFPLHYDRVYPPSITRLSPVESVSVYSTSWLFTRWISGALLAVYAACVCGMLTSMPLTVAVKIMLPFIYNPFVTLAAAYAVQNVPSNSTSIILLGLDSGYSSAGKQSATIMSRLLSSIYGDYLLILAMSRNVGLI